MWDERNLKMSWQAATQGDRSKGRPQTDFGRRDTQDFE
jgi:hypothetical protein